MISELRTEAMGWGTEVVDSVGSNLLRFWDVDCSCGWVIFIGWLAWLRNAVYETSSAIVWRGITEILAGWDKLNARWTQETRLRQAERAVRIARVDLIEVGEDRQNRGLNAILNIQLEKMLLWGRRRLQRTLRAVT